MRVHMTHRLYRGGANVLPEEVATWEAAGWVADRKPAKKAETPKPIEDKETEE